MVRAQTTSKMNTCTSNLKLSVRIPMIYICTGFVCFFGLAGRLTSQAVIYNEVHKDGVGGVDGLAGSSGVVVSPDGKHVYCASSLDDAVTVFSRDLATGDLTFIEVHKDDGQTGGTIDGLHSAQRLNISSDGEFLYVPSSIDDAVVVFSRDTDNGTLTYVETQKDGVGGVNGLDGAFQVAISPDDTHVYVTGSVDDAVAVFSRNSSTGKLSYVESKINGIGGVSGLNSARGIVVAPDGNHVYVTSSIDDAIVVFSRNISTGALTFKEKQTDGVDGVDGLNGAYGVFVSNDNKNVYTTGMNDDAVAVFTRNESNGTLTYLEVHKDDTQGGSISNLNAARYLTGTSNGNYILVVSSSDDALVVFNRNGLTGALTFNEDHRDAISGIDGLDGARAVVLNSNDKNVYVAGSSDNAIAVFDAGPSLPVELLYFQLEEQLGEVVISWATATEVNNDYFTVERSADGRSWAELMMIDGAGNSATLLEYKEVDPAPLPGKSYYRLRQTDGDGTENYSKVQVIRMSDTQLEMYPNPVRDHLSIEGAPPEVTSVRIYNLIGEDVTSKTGIMAKTTSPRTIDLSNLIPGMYIIKTNSATRLIYKQ